jgi:hypothetical protein
MPARRERAGILSRMKRAGAKRAHRQGELAELIDAGQQEAGAQTLIAMIP